MPMMTNTALVVLEDSVDTHVTVVLVSANVRDVLSNSSSCCTEHAVNSS